MTVGHKKAALATMPVCGKVTEGCCMDVLPAQLIIIKSQLKTQKVLLFVFIFKTLKQGQVTDGRHARWKFTPAVTAPIVRPFGMHCSITTRVRCTSLTGSHAQTSVNDTQAWHVINRHTHVGLLYSTCIN